MQAADAGKAESLMTEKICHEVFLCARGANVFPALRTIWADRADFMRAGRKRLSGFRRIDAEDRNFAQMPNCDMMK